MFQFYLQFLSGDLQNMFVGSNQIAKTSYICIRKISQIKLDMHMYDFILITSVQFITDFTKCCRILDFFAFNRAPGSHNQESNFE